MWPSEIKRDCSRVPTGLTGPKGVALLEAIKGQLSDGYWENSPRMEAYWRFFSAELNDDGTVDVLVSNAPLQLPYGRSRAVLNKPRELGPAKFLKWLADRVYDMGRYEQATWPENEFKFEAGNSGKSVCMGLSRDLTGGDLWAMRKQLATTAKQI